DMAPHAPQRSSRAGEAGPRLDLAPRGWGPEMVPGAPQRSSRPGEAGPRLDTSQRLSRLVSVIGLSIRGGPLWALLRAGDAGALEAVEYGREIGARRGAQRCPEVAGAPHACGQRRQREVAMVDARVDLAPGQRRGGAREVRAARAVRRRQCLAA